MARLTKPGKTDLHWMVVICDKAETRVTFHETPREAKEYAKQETKPGSSSYVGNITHQLENLRRTRAQRLADPACVTSMGCLCAGHARGLDASSPCDTRETQTLDVTEPVVEHGHLGDQERRAPRRPFLWFGRKGSGRG